MNRVSFLWIAFVLVSLPANLKGLEPLPSDVTARFEAGVHWVVGCESCHWEEPDRTPRKRIPSVCGDCHPGPHDDYETSVHWSGGEAHAVCTDCHGIHGILPVANPESKAYRSLVCGKCHPGPMEELLEGPHGTAFEKTHALVCSSCHSNHAVQHPTIAVVEAACESCHSRTGDAFAMGQQVEAQFTTFRQKADDAGGAVLEAAENGYESKRAVQALASAKGQFTQARLVWHSLNEDQIDLEIDKASALADRSVAIVNEGKDIQKTREGGIAVVWIVILLAIIALHLKRKSLETEIE
jgi:hypothetical protein